MESDEELITAVNNGEAGAFETLYYYYRYRDWVYRLAGRFTFTDVLDVLQETME